MAAKAHNGAAVIETINVSINDLLGLYIHISCFLTNQETANLNKSRILNFSQIINDYNVENKHNLTE